MDIISVFYCSDPRLLIESTISPADHSFIDIHVTCAILYIHVYGSPEYN